MLLLNFQIEYSGIFPEPSLLYCKDVLAIVLLLALPLETFEF